MYYGLHTINQEAEHDNYYEYSSSVGLNEIAYPIRCFKD